MAKWFADIWLREDGHDRTRGPNMYGRYFRHPEARLDIRTRPATAWHLEAQLLQVGTYRGHLKRVVTLNPAGPVTGFSEIGCACPTVKASDVKITARNEVHLSTLLTEPHVPNLSH